MDENTIMERIAELNAQSEKLKADYQAVNGAIQECRIWLDKVKRCEQVLTDKAS